MGKSKVVTADSTNVLKAKFTFPPQFYCILMKKLPKYIF